MLVDTAVLFCGGHGTRMGNLTKDTPKHLLDVNGKPFIEYIINSYRSHGIKRFMLLSGFGYEDLKDLYKDDSSVRVYDTGEDTSKLNRLSSVLSILPDLFFLTYADGYSDVSHRTVSNFHWDNPSQPWITLTAVPFKSKFGVLEFDGYNVVGFSEKENLPDTWINGGFMVVHRQAIIHALLMGLEDFEKDVLPYFADKGLIGAYKHEGTWFCIDTPKDLKRARKILS